MEPSHIHPDDNEVSWSEETTPSSEPLVQEILPTIPVATGARIRRNLGIRRRVHPKDRLHDKAAFYNQGQATALISYGSMFNIEMAAQAFSSCSSSNPVESASSLASPNRSSSMSDYMMDGIGDVGNMNDLEDMDENAEFERLLQPKIEPASPDQEVSMGGLLDSRSFPNSNEKSGTPAVQQKRPRGRPRKHPVPTIDPASKVAKGRSKTGCITCRKRKKKCDETKPRCLNCEKNAVLCEGYPERTVWKSGKEKAEEAQSRRVSLPHIKLQPVIHGVDTSGDRIFFEHYVFRLSAVLTVEGPQNNAFKDMLLPMAVKHLGLMHSILALSSSNIDYETDYGKSLLVRHPGVDQNALEERGQFHQHEALREFYQDIERQKHGVIENAILSVRYGQMLCMVVQSIAEGKTTGEHRIHLQGYQKLIRESPPEDGPFMEFIKEYFQYHIMMDELISAPDATAVEEYEREWSIPPVVPNGIIQPEAGRLLGVQDRLLVLMSKITGLRNRIRVAMEMGNDPVVDYSSLYRASIIDAEIRDWKSSLPEGDSRYIAGLLYKQMLWVYLWRTIYPPKATTWAPDAKITVAVDDALQLLSLVPQNDSSQTLLLAPSFIIGCAAFEEHQREAIRRSIQTIHNYTSLKNTDRALQVLEEVWRFMDMKDERSWDWQCIAKDMHMDFLVT